MSICAISTAPFTLFQLGYASGDATHDHWLVVGRFSRTSLRAELACEWMQSEISKTFGPRNVTTLVVETNFGPVTLVAIPPDDDILTLVEVQAKDLSERGWPTEDIPWQQIEPHIHRFWAECGPVDRVFLVHKAMARQSLVMHDTCPTELWPYVQTELLAS